MSSVEEWNSWALGALVVTSFSTAALIVLKTFRGSTCTRHGFTIEREKQDDREHILTVEIIISRMENQMAALVKNQNKIHRSLHTLSTNVINMKASIDSDIAGMEETIISNLEEGENNKKKQTRRTLRSKKKSERREKKRKNSLQQQQQADDYFFQPDVSPVDIVETVAGMEQQHEQYSSDNQQQQQ